MTVTSNKQIAEELSTALFTNGDLTAVTCISIQTSSTMTGNCQIRRIGLRACVNQAEFSATPYLVPAERTAPQ